VPALFEKAVPPEAVATASFVILGCAERPPGVTTDSRGNDWPRRWLKTIRDHPRDWEHSLNL